MKKSPDVVGEGAVKEWYKSYYAKGGMDRNSLRLNPGVLFQILAAEKSLIFAVRNIAQDVTAAKVLDVGCGGGGDLYQLLRLGYVPENITGIDIQQDRLLAARRLYPSVHFVKGDASKMEFSGGAFDLVFESTMFATLPDEELSAKIAAEMLRVCKPGGYLMLVDWRTPKPGDANYLALTRTRLERLFSVNSETELVGLFPGALVPPLGRFLSKHLPSLYFLVVASFPFLVGQVAYLLRRKA